MSKDPCTLSFVIAAAGSSTLIFSLSCLLVCGTKLWLLIMRSHDLFPRLLPFLCIPKICLSETPTYVALPFVASVFRQFIPSAINESNVIAVIMPREITQ